MRESANHGLPSGLTQLVYNDLGFFVTSCSAVDSDHPCCGYPDLGLTIDEGMGLLNRSRDEVRGEHHVRAKRGWGKMEKKKRYVTLLIEAPTEMTRCGT